MPQTSVEPYSWWAALKHGGLLIAPSRIAEYFPDGLAPLAANVEHRLRADLTRLESDEGKALAPLLDTVLEEVLGLGRTFHPETGHWLKGNDVSADWTHRSLTGEAVKPRRLWQGPNGAMLPVFVDTETRVGVGRGRRSAARVVEWLRRAGKKVAILTNGRQWRLIYAGLDHEAFAEADSSLWFEEGAPGPQVTAIRELLSPAAVIAPAEGKPSRLLAAIEATRKGQAELSSELGERVRQSVEMLIREQSSSIDRLVRDDPQVTARHIYLAATRVVMRMVVVLFAEARDLLPIDNPIYYNCYGLSGLRDLLERSAAGAGSERLRRYRGAWPRILALFRIVHEGSSHEALPVLRYSGGLFEPGNQSASDPLLRALPVFETIDPAPSDATVHQVLRLLTRSRVRVRQGRSSTWVEAPVDFSDLSSEYIGILYEGLLDFELRRAPEADPIVFLALGDEPALPLSRLEGTDDERIRTLLEKFKQKKQIVLDEGGDDVADEVEEGEADYEEGGEPAAEAAEEVAVYDVAREDSSAEPDSGDDRRHAELERALAWARRAVVAAKVVRKPRSNAPAAQREYEAATNRTAGALIARIVLPGEWFLVRFGGTRKGSGTFYTRPQLAVPTTQRTLRPLAYNPPRGSDGAPDDDAPPASWRPKKPEEILALKVCDPACGSGSFLVASLRFLTDALVESLHCHGRIQAQGDQTLVTLAEGKPDNGRLDVEPLPCRPNAEDFEPRLRARLKRYVVERCIYGVDVDPLAVELARLSLWVETMDRSLPFSFLDHKIKCGNSLVGCWFDRFRDYPVLAWEREGGDKGHDRGVHFQKEAWTKAIKAFRNQRVKPAMADWIRGQGALFEQVGGHTPEALHDEALAVLEKMHALPVHETDERSRFYRERVLCNLALSRLKDAFDTWCSLWFWPADRLDFAPLPGNFADPPEETRKLVSELVTDLRFFHWELEFPDVFARPGSGFDAIVGNPPWENLQANPAEFFSNVDPLFRTYGRLESQDALRRFFTSDTWLERAWLLYCARFKAYGNWSRNACEPFGDSEAGAKEFSLGHGNRELQSRWRERRAGSRGYADLEHPFRHQYGGRVFTYKLFLELSHALLRIGGHMGVIVPSGFYTDKGTTQLRDLFLMRCQWRWLFGIINWNKIFEPIYYRFKFCIAIIQKNGATSDIRSAFSRYHIEEWEQAERHVIPYSRAQVERFSPKTRAILEIRERRDLEVLEKIYRNSILLGENSENGWEIQYALEFMMNTDAHLFPPRSKWEADGYKPDEYGRWIKGDWQSRRPTSPAPPDAPRYEIEPGVILSRDGSEWIREPESNYIALPLYEGRMIGQFDFSQKGWVSGKGRGAVWREIPWETKSLEPQFMMSKTTFAEREASHRGFKLAIMDVTSSTNARTMISASIPGFPCGHKAPTLTPARSHPHHVLPLCGALNSFVFDFLARIRLGGLSLIWGALEEIPILSVYVSTNPNLLGACARLSLADIKFAVQWLQIRYGQPAEICWRIAWATAPAERLRLRCMIDAIVTLLYKVTYEDLIWVLHDCDWPPRDLRDKGVYRTLDPKGFWRVDKDKDPELRHTILTVAAFCDLKEKITSCGGDADRGIEAFCSQNGGEGWMLPETLCLADLGLGHDDRARKPQPVRSRFGERFFPWQLDQSVEDSWKECELHARNILGAEGFAQLKAQLQRERETGYATQPDEISKVAETEGSNRTPSSQRRLFPGQKTLFGDTMEDPPGSKKR